MAREIVGTQTKEMLNYWNPFCTARVVIDLSGPLQRRNIVGKYLQCPAKGSERLFFLLFTGVGHALHGPQLAITGKFLERYLKEVECSVKLLGTQCGGDRLDGLCSCLRTHGGEKQNRTCEADQLERTKHLSHGCGSVLFRGTSPHPHGDRTARMR